MSITLLSMKWLAILENLSFNFNWQKVFFEGPDGLLMLYMNFRIFITDKINTIIYVTYNKEKNGVDSTRYFPFWLISFVFEVVYFMIIS